MSKLNEDVHFRLWPNHSIFFFFFRLRLELYIPTGEHSFLDPEVLVSFKAIGLPKALFHQFGSR